MKFRIDLDIDANCPVQTVLDVLSKYSATIINFEAFGPAGGNPCFILEFECKQNAVGLITELYEGDCQHYIDNIRGV